MKTINPNKWYDIQGQKMFLNPNCPYISKPLFENGIYDKDETNLFKSEIKEGNIVIDIGANIGFYTLIFAEQVGKTGKVFAFEPDPLNYRILKKNIEINGYKNVELIQKAVSDKNGELKLYISDENPGDHRIYNSNDNRKFFEIEAITLDDYFHTYPNDIDFIKMDTQGAEQSILKGMSKLLNRNKKLKMSVEFWPIGLKRIGGDAKNYLLELKAHNFELYDINKKIVKIQSLIDQNPLESEGFTNLFVVKS